MVVLCGDEDESILGCNLLGPSLGVLVLIALHPRVIRLVKEGEVNLSQVQDGSFKTLVSLDVAEDPVADCLAIAAGASGANDYTNAYFIVAHNGSFRVDRPL